MHDRCSMPPSTNRSLGNLRPCPGRLRQSEIQSATTGSHDCPRNIFCPGTLVPRTLLRPAPGRQHHGSQRPGRHLPGADSAD
eukprot:7922322-Alexandrium_andersonii.AAC.1